MRGTYSKCLMWGGGVTKIAACALLLLIPSLDAHAQVDADFRAYCREHYPNSRYEKTEQSWGIQHNCNQGGTRQGIDLAEACRLTTGNPAHKTMGARVICDKARSSDQTAARGIAGPLDLNAWCRTNFPNSIPETRFEPTGIRHYCRRPGATGGFTLQPVDLAKACQEQRNVSGFLKAGKQVVCLRSDATAAAGGGRAGGGGGAGGGDKKFPPLKPEDIVDAKGAGKLAGKNIKYANLRGCGNADPEFRLKLPPTSMRRGLGDQTFDYMGLTMSCPGLKGGKVVQFQQVCNEFSGAKPPMEARLLPEGLPICWKAGQRKWPPRLRAGEAGWGLNGLSLTGVCNEAYLGRPLRPQELREMNVTSLLKYQAKSLQIECFYIKTDILLRLLKDGEKTSLMQAADDDKGAANTPDDASKPDAGGDKQPAPVDLKSLSDEDFYKEVVKTRKAIDAAKKELAEIRQDARYPGVDPAPLKRDNETRYKKKKQEIDAEILRVQKERGEEINRKKIASDCSNVGLCEKMELQKYDTKIQQLNDKLTVIREDLDAALILEHGDEKSREKLRQLRPRLKSLREWQAKLAADEIIRDRKALEKARKLGPGIPGLDESEGPLIPR